jgi:hypothetical protein
MLRFFDRLWRDLTRMLNRLCFTADSLFFLIEV